MKKVAFLFLVLSLISCSRKMPLMEAGLFDLRRHDFSANPIVALDGTWEFYWQQLYSPVDFKESLPEKTGFIEVPSAWNDRSVGNTKLTGYGFATYRAVVLLPADSAERMELYVGEINSSYKIFVNNRLSIARGKVGVSGSLSQPEWDNALLTINTESKKLELVIQVANYDFVTGGIAYKSISIGKEGSLTKQQRKRVALETILFTLLLLLGFFNLIIFIFRRQEYTFLWMTLLCFCFAVSAFTTGERELYHLFFPNHFKVVTSLAHFPNYCGVMLIFLFVSTVFPGEVPARLRCGIAAFFSLATAFVLIFPARIYSWTMYPNILANGLLGLYITFILVKAVQKKRDGALIFTAGWFSALAVAVPEALGIMGVIRLNEALPLGAVFFAAFHTILLFIRFAGALTASEQLADNLRAINNLKDDFLARTSHEFRTPLHAIKGIAGSMLEEGSERLTSENRTNLEVIIQSSRRLAYLVNDIIDFYTMKHTSLQLRKKPVNLYAIANTVLSLVRFLNPSHKVEIINAIPPDLEAVYADEYRMQQVLLNLTENSLKHTIEGRVSLHAVSEGSRTVVTVQDTGKGIPTDKQEEVFRMFEAIDIRTQEGAPPGSGIGLAITKQLIELHEGKLSLTSVPGKGTAISFSLPVYTGEERAVKMITDTIEPVPEELRGKEIPGTGRGTILIIDDEVSNLQVIKNFIRQLGYACRIELTGEEALAFLRTERTAVSLIILDVTLPGMNGYEVCKAVRAEYSLYELPVLMVTARISSLDLVAGFDAGANDYITKPFDKDEFLTRVKTLLKLYHVLHANADLEKTSALKQLFLTLLSHDIRDPLFSLKMSLDGLVSEEAGIEKKQEMINALYSEIFYLENLAERFLKLTEIENGNVRCIKILFDPFEELRKIVEKNTVIGKIKKQTILYHPQMDMKVKIHADKDFFLSIYNNIISNAMKFSPRREKIIVKAVLVEDTDEDKKSFFRVEVRDRGPGLPEVETWSVLPGTAAATGGEPSAGVGLYIVRHLVDLHAGQIKFHNNASGGSTVTIDLPLCER